MNRVIGRVTKLLNGRSLAFAAAVLGFCMSHPAVAQNAPAARSGERCTVGEVQKMVAPNVRIDNVRAVESTAVLPAYCAVQGYIVHDAKIGFSAALPSRWNGKFLFYGIGGFAGLLNPLDAPPQNEGLVRGYATATTDTGHQSPTVEDATWALDNSKAVIAHFETSVELSAEATKELVAAFYGRAPAHAYFEGCSAGGRQALVEAERFPSTFDGIIAAAPAWDYSALLATFIMNAQEILRSPGNWISPETFAAVDREVLRQCDKIDGAADGIIMDPRKCRLDLTKMACHPDVKGTDCLTPAQVAILDKIIHPAFAKTRPGYYGYYLTGTDRSGPFFGWPDWMFGTKPTTKDKSGKLNFAGHVLTGPEAGRGPNQFLLGEQFFRYMVMNDPAFDARTFNYDRDMAILRRRLGGYLDATDTNLGRFIRAGGKLLIWHGWSDGAIPPGMAIDLYGRIRRDTADLPGQPSVNQSVRLFMAPGVQHCSWGTGLTEFDMLPALESWVEQGRTPERIVASQLVDGKPARSRPLCSYPKAAHYRGVGDPDKAESFECQ